MNVRISFVPAVALAAALTVPLGVGAQSTFEGVVTFQAEGGPRGGGPQTTQYSVKGQMVRWDVAGPQGNMFVIVDGTKHVIDMVVPMRKMYIEHSIENAEAKMDSAASGAKIKWTGKKETIAGHECEDATITASDGTNMDVCLAKGLGTFLPMGGGRGGMAGSWEHLIGKTFPLKVVRDGKVELLATKIEKKSLADSLFTVPAGYSKMDFPGMGGGR